MTLPTQRRPFVNTTCPYTNEGLIAVWQRGRRDGYDGVPHRPDSVRSGPALEAYQHGHKLGHAEFCQEQQ